MDTAIKRRNVVQEEMKWVKSDIYQSGATDEKRRGFQTLGKAGNRQAQADQGSLIIE